MSTRTTFGQWELMAPVGGCQHDTGVRYSHQALVEQYRGNNGGTFDHNYNWFNPDDLTDDDHAMVRSRHPHHGHHGGDDGGSNQIGIAPGAEWMPVQAALMVAVRQLCWDADNSSPRQPI
jgi:hypothetical protein